MTTEERPASPQAVGREAAQWTAEDMYAWCHDMAENMDLMENREIVVYHVPKHEAAMCFVIRALANPRCEGSEQMLAAIMEQRARADEGTRKR